MRFKRGAALYFAHPRSDKHNCALFEYRIGTSSKCHRIEDKRFVFKFNQSIQVGKDLYVFTEYSGVRVTKFTNGCADLKTDLTQAGQNLMWYSLALYERMAIYLTAGWTRRASAKVFSYYLHTDSWHEEPSLNYARRNHGSCVMGTNLFVFAGWNRDFQDSIECLNLIFKQTWDIFKVKQLTKRQCPSVCKIGKDECVIMGGDNCGSQLSDVIIFHGKTRTAKTVQKNCGLKFWCRSTTYRVSDDSVLSLVDDSKDELHLVKYNRTTNQLITIDSMGPK